MANLYYDETLSSGDLVPGSIVPISGDEGRHAVRVARLREGERILFGNGQGLLALGEVETVERDAFSVRVIESREQAASDRPLVLVQALAKSDRDERAVEQATEFGVDVVIPWQAERSVSRWGDVEKADKGVAKWQRIAREASKQSLRARMPRVLEPVSTTELAAYATAGAQLLVLHPGAHRLLSEYAYSQVLSFMRAEREGLGRIPDDLSAALFVIVGPEGGLSAAELAELEAAGAVSLRLGDTVLRTSSAGPAALAVLNVALGRW